MCSQYTNVAGILDWPANLPGWRPKYDAHFSSLLFYPLLVISLEQIIFHSSFKFQTAMYNCLQASYGDKAF